MRFIVKYAYNYIPLIIYIVCGSLLHKHILYIVYIYLCMYTYLYIVELELPCRPQGTSYHVLSSSLRAQKVALLYVHIALFCGTMMCTCQGTSTQ